eukprot:gene31527-36061_t
MTVLSPPAGFIGPVKRSVTIAGHATSISLEPIFWQVLEAAAARRSLPLNALIAQIDALRIIAEDPPNLASALRSWILSDLSSINREIALTLSTVRKPVYLALSCVGAFASHPAFADDAPPVPANDADPDAKLDIIVHGQRRTDPKQVAPLLDTPKSILVLNKDTIAQTGSNSLADALRTVPGITFGAAEGGNPIGDRPFIRGFDSQGSIYVDGVRDLASQSREVFAVDSVQIVRGSDSTLGGRG